MLWTRADIKKSTPQNAREISGTPLLVCNTFGGIMGSKVTFKAIDDQSGETVWSSEEIAGQYLGTIPVPSKHLVIFVVNTAGTNDDGIYFLAHDLDTGARKWSTKFGKSGVIPLHPADNSGRFIPTLDLSGYHDPVIDGDDMYVGYLGVHCVDLRTGAINWGVEFPAGNKTLKKTYAPLRIVGDRIYGGGGGSVYAIDRRHGTIAWKSDRISEYAGLFKARDNAIVAQLEIVGGKIFARYGGAFSDGHTAALREPVGVVALDPADGKTLYHFDQAKEGMTNLAVLPNTETLVFADGAKVYGIDAASQTPVELFAVPIEFKRKMGAGAVAKIGLGALGGVSGLVKGAMAATKGLRDVPVAVHLQGGLVIVQGKQHLLGFDPKTKSAVWSLYYAAPSDALGNIAMFAVTAAAAIYGNGQVAASGGIGTSSYGSGVSTIQGSLDCYNQFAEKASARAGGSKASESYSYIITKLEKDIGVVGVNLASGATDRELALKDKEPEYLVDEPTSRVFHFKSHDTVVCYQF